MNRALLVVVVAAVVAFVLIQVEGQYGGVYGGFRPGFGGSRGPNAQAIAVNRYYQDYYRRYNQLQTFQALRRVINGLRSSSLISLASTFALAILATNASGRAAG